MSSIKVSFFGAAGEVTGSKHLIETPGGSKVLLDCGMFQGKREEAMEKNSHFGFDPASLDAVILSHAHIDHSGLLPKLAREGFKGKIYTSKGTRDLSAYMLRDSARIQMEDEDFVRRHKIKNPFSRKIPLYNEDDVRAVMKQFVGKEYNKVFKITDDISVELKDAGHVLGSAMVVLKIKTSAGTRKLVFTGDIGRKNTPILQDPDQISEADYLIIESTYGNREHERVTHTDDDFKYIINKTAKKGGKILIPSFALERTQEILLRLEDLIRNKQIPNFPIYLDSPLAGNITRVFEKHPEYYDEDMKKRAGKNPQVFSFSNLRFTESVLASKELNYINHPCIIIAGSGMCESGRIRHHLIHNIEDSRNSVLIVGYQAEETLGRRLVEGEKFVEILGRNFEVNAEIYIFKSLSAHADMNDLDEFLTNIKGLRDVFIVHGEDEARQDFAKRVKKYYKKAEVILPGMGESYEL